ncbi:hypothetical protein SELMODRAFT_416735 [Selaginella moellendorffii]|uniref:GIR1-like zinc ribbon domain-containing protein n=1 Tax=Selaginella moellendorffii TaxID=88036 RepID=D8S088_SELML|nr:uncharacterized protein LOC9649346 [Selaginella moellendorffii]EFJ22439.1 hypothetical protein SELMODRAFT_416735 [Selaginella moellendorffii]|eukprot:XP_002976770.1 uncharacterized protein LOC9649346 [Selaginella moellendorffii]
MKCCPPPQSSAASYHSSLSVDSLLEIVDSKQPLPSGWEKCLDLKSGVVYFRNRVSGDKSYAVVPHRLPLQSLEHSQSFTQNSLHDRIHLSSERIQVSSGTSSSSSSSSSGVVVDLELGLGQTAKENIRGSTVSMTGRSRPLLQIEIEDLDLRLTLRPMSSSQQQQQVAMPPPPPPPSPSHVSISSSSSSPCSSTTQVGAESCEAESRKSKRQKARAKSQEWPVMVTVGCRQCLMYVMLSKDNLCCPKCGNRVPLDFIPAA